MRFMTDLPPGLAKPAQRALAEAGVTQLEQLTHFGADEIAQMHGIGPNALRVLRQALDEQGLSFAE
jgi:predicted flap endonuclease-1-like 5' DNA nuclease